MPSRRSRPISGRRAQLAAGLCLVVSIVLLLAPASAPAEHQTYLALGDSLAFGFRQATFNSLNREGDPAAESPVYFDKGYVDDLGRLLQPYRPGIEIINDGCPGETTTSFIKGPCEYQLEYRLHHPYHGGRHASQLSDAIHYLDTHPGRVSPITLDIGGNDALGVIYGDCESASACIASHEPALLSEVARNLRLILARLKAHDHGAQIIVLGLYNPFGSSIAGAGELVARLNATEATQARIAGARFADPLPVFNPPEPLEAPTICRLLSVCEELHDIHPTYAGYEELANLLLAQYLGPGLQ
jgi:lysophospholipase L1-like esterase